MRLNILLIDDDNDVRRAVQFALTSRGHQVTSFARPDEAREFLGTNLMWQDFDVVVTDYQMPHMTGLSVARIVHNFYQMPAIIMTGLDTIAEMTEVECERIPVLKKPFKMQELAAALVKVKRAAKRG